jgi:Ser/Thr protein kinase RdoA (MazF antagonist)
MNGAEQAAEEFLGKSVLSVEPLPMGTANRHFIVTNSQGEEYVLRRRSTKYASLEFASFEAEYCLHLAAKGIPVPALLQTRSDQPFLALDGTLWQMSRRLPGALASGTLEQVHQAGCFLQRYHQALSDFTPRHERRLPRYEQPQTLDERFRALAGSLSEDEQAQLQPVRGIIERIAAEIPDSIYLSLPRIHIHGDYHRHNLLFSGNEVSGIFDFDQASRQARLRDLVDGLIFFASDRASEIDDTRIVSLTQSFVPDPVRIGIFLHGYTAGLKEPLSSAEKEAMKSFMAARFIGMRLDGMAKVPPEQRKYLLLKDLAQPFQWLTEHPLC